RPRLRGHLRVVAARHGVILLQRLAVAALGVYAGGNLTEGVVLVPYRRSLAPAGVYAWYAAHDPGLLRVFTARPRLAAAVARGASAVPGDPGRWHSALAAVATLAAGLTFPVYFRQANAGFSAGTVADLPAELRRWAAWHWARTACTLGALVAALLAAG